MHFLFFLRKVISFTSISKTSISLGVRPLDPLLVFAPAPHWVTSVPQDTFPFAALRQSTPPQSYRAVDAIDHHHRHHVFINS